MNAAWTFRLWLSPKDVVRPRSLLILHHTAPIAIATCFLAEAREPSDESD